MGDKTDGGTCRPEGKPNIIKCSKLKSENKDKKTKFIPETEAKDIKKPNLITNVPDTNLPLACLVSLCFNFPLGIIAMYLSLSAARLYRDGNVVKGEKRAKLSVFLSLFSIVTTVLIVTAIVVWIVIDDQTKREMKKLKT